MSTTNCLLVGIFVIIYFFWIGVSPEVATDCTKSAWDYVMDFFNGNLF